MKKKTQLEHSQIANNMMYYIFKHIETPINMDELAQELGVSKFHLHRLFKKQMGSNIYESVNYL